jgi:hypothetical protein
MDSGVRCLLTSAAVVFGMAPFTARADLPEPNHAGAALANGTLSAQTGASLYMMSSGAAATFAGPKLTIEYGVPTTRRLSFTTGVGLTLGACLARGDEGDCAFRPGYAVEPLAGIVLKSRPAGRAWAYAKIVGGVVLVIPDARPLGAAALLRAGGGVRYDLSQRVTIGLEATGAVGVGHFELNYQDVERQLVGLELGVVLAARL